MHNSSCEKAALIANDTAIKMRKSVHKGTLYNKNGSIFQFYRRILLHYILQTTILTDNNNSKY
jgi:hypothetical protein